MSKTRTRQATREDFNELMRLYRQLQPADPILDDGSDLTIFTQILDDPNLFLFVLPIDAHLRASVYLNLVPRFHQR